MTGFWCNRMPPKARGQRDTIGESFERTSYHFEVRVSLIGECHQVGICNTSILLTHSQTSPHHGCRPIQGRSMRKMNKHGYQNTMQIHVKETQTWTYLPDIQCISISCRHKFQHNNDHSNVDPCQESYKYSIVTWGNQ